MPTNTMLKSVRYFPIDGYIKQDDVRKEAGYAETRRFLADFIQWQAKRKQMVKEYEVEGIKFYKVEDIAPFFEHRDKVRGKRLYVCLKGTPEELAIRDMAPRMTIPEVAKLLGLPPRRVHSFIRHNKIPYLRARSVKGTRKPKPVKHCRECGAELANKNRTIITLWCTDCARKNFVAKQRALNHQIFGSR